MTATLDDVTKKTRREPTAEERAAEELVRRAREQGLSLTGPDGLLKQLTKTVLETALNQELTEHLGHEKHGRPDPGLGEHPQRDPGQDGADGEYWPGPGAGAPGPGRDVRAADRQEAAAAADRGR